MAWNEMVLLLDVVEWIGCFATVVALDIVVLDD